MRDFFLIVFFVFLFQGAEADSCVVLEASAESTRSLVERVGISSELGEGLADVVIHFPAMADGYVLNGVFFVASKEGSDELEILIPVETRELDNETIGVTMTLPVSLIDRVSLVVSYGRCALEHTLQLAELMRLKNTLE